MKTYFPLRECLKHQLVILRGASATKNLGVEALDRDAEWGDRAVQHDS